MADVSPEELASLVSQEPPPMSPANAPAPMPDAAPPRPLPSFIPAPAAPASMPAAMPDAAPQGVALGLPSFFPRPQAPPDQAAAPSGPQPSSLMVPRAPGALSPADQLSAMGSAQRSAGFDQASRNIPQGPIARIGGAQVNPFLAPPEPAASPALAADANKAATNPKAIPAAIAKAYGTAVAAGASPQNALAAAYATNKTANDESFDKERDSVDRTSMAQAGAEVQKADVFESQAQDLVAEKEANARAEAEYQRAHAAEVQAIKDAQDKAKAQVIDPNHFYNSKSTGEKVWMHIASFLGGLGQGLGGGTNPAVERIKREQEADINAQKANIDQGWEGVKANRAMLDAMERAGVDRRNSSVVQRGLMLDAAKAQVEKLAAGQQSAAVQGRAAQLIGGLDREKAALDLQATVTPLLAQQRAAAAAPAAAGKGGSFGAKNAQGNDDLYVPGAGGYAKDKEEATRLNKLTEATTNIEQVAARLDSIRDTQGMGGRAADKLGDAFGYETESHAQLAQGKEELALQLKNLYELGAISESDAAMLNHLVGDPHAVWSGAEKKKLEGVIASAKNMQQNAYKSAGIQKVQRGYAPDQNGELHPVTEFTGANTAKPSAPAPRMPTSFKPVGS